MKLTQKTTIKAKLNQTLRNWLPILQASSDDLQETLEPFVADNPFIAIQSKFKDTSKKNYNEFYKTNANESVEIFSVYKESLYEKLYSQINSDLFPTKKSIDIANSIIECINCEGYFEWNEEVLSKFDKIDVEKIRLRFSYLEPIGVGAKDFKESFLFQLDELCNDDEIYDFTKKLILDFENLSLYTKEKLYEKATKLIKKFKNPPAIEYLEDDRQIIPDIFVYQNNGEIEISVNDEFYPDIIVQTDGLDEKCDFISSRLKIAKDLIDALEMRKATLYKIGLMIIEYQYDYFFGGDIKPMKLKDIADDLGRNPSTISRAIQNKFLSSSRGILPIKSFFSTAASEDISNAAIKDFIKNLIKTENRLKPFNDEAILNHIEKEFNIKLVRRTITKYRKALNIASSSERKKLYIINS